MIAGCYIPLGQALLLAGLHFYVLRVLILFGVVRIALRGELVEIRPNRIDAILISGVLVETFLFVLFDGTNTTLTGRLGAAYDALGTYTLVRASIKSTDDALALVNACAVVTIPVAIPFFMESTSGHNPFAALGGVSPLSEIRNGHVRCSGPFRHAILAGTFGATMMPLFVGALRAGKGSRLLAALAIASSTTVVITSRSSGPLSAFAVACMGLAMWPLRGMMRLVRWGMVLGLLTLAVVMKQPIWFLIARVSDLTGGGGWYRSGLIDAAVRHFDEWWLVGTGYTAHWMATGAIVDPNSADLVNEFVFQGVNGGILAVILLVSLIVKCFKTAGIAARTSTHPVRTQFAIWSMGCALLAHVTSFFSVSYFDQIVIFWYLVIGLIVGVAPKNAMVAAGELIRPATDRPAGQDGGFSHDFYTFSPTVVSHGSQPLVAASRRGSARKPQSSANGGRRRDKRP